MNITYADIKDKLQPPLDCSSISDLRGKHFYRRFIKNYENADLSGCVLLQCFPNGIPNAIEVDPSEQKFDVTLEGADLSGAVMRNMAWGGRRPDDELKFIGLSFERSNFSKARCTLIEFDNSSFAHADFRDATFKSCSFKDCKFENTDLRGARFFNCDLWGAKLSNVKVDQSTQIFDLHDSTYIDEHTEIYIEAGTRLVNHIELDSIDPSDYLVVKTFSHHSNPPLQWEDLDAEEKDELIFQWLKTNTTGLDLIIESEDEFRR